MDDSRAVKGAAGLLLLAGIAACGPDQLPPRGEAIVMVDTDLPVPGVVDRLRIDLYDEDGSWFFSRDLPRPDPRDWPASFSVYAEEARAALWVRLRVYPTGRVRSYRGERFADWGAPLVPPRPPPGEVPRLLVAGEDVTPESEPMPLVTVDHLVRIALEEGLRGRVHVTLHGACAGTMARLSSTTSELGPGAESCIDQERQREPVKSYEVEREVSQVPASRANSLAPTSCSGDEQRACIPGGATILGSMEVTLVPDLPTIPERIVLHEAFFADRGEVTVGRYRAALEGGFVPPDPVVSNDGPLALDPTLQACTYSQAPMGREGLPLSCVSWHTARAFCQHAGGDLPSEAQWEHMATLASDQGRSRFPWGDAPPSCDRAAYGRTTLAGEPGVCEHLGQGPAFDAPGDVTREGVFALAGGLSEWQRDTLAPYDGACWSQSPVKDPFCEDEGSDTRTLRGGAWPAPPTYLPSAVRTGIPPTGEASFIGFRCVYPFEEIP